jgi:hypothetical protein
MVEVSEIRFLLLKALSGIMAVVLCSSSILQYFIINYYLGIRNLMNGSNCYE